MRAKTIRFRRTHRPLYERVVLAADKSLGAGNFFWRSYRVLRHKDRPLFFTEDRVYTPRDLAGHVTATMDHYRSEGVTGGSHVGVQVNDGVTGFVHHVALTSLGAVVVHCNPRMDHDRSRAYFAKAKVDQVFSDFHGRGLNAYDLRWKPVASLGSQAPAVGIVPNPRFEANHPIMISHSSGTTGAPKTPMFTHGGFFVGKRERLFTFAQGIDERLLTGLPHSHSAGLSYMTTSLLTGTPLYVHNRDSPLPIEDAINKFRPTGILAFPSTLADLDPARLDQSASQTIRFWNGMGDASHAGHIRRLLDITDNAVYIDGLGSSEMGMVLFQCVKTRDVRSTRDIGSTVGVVADVAVFDDHGRKLPAGSAGRLGVLTPSSTPGYFGDTELTSQSEIGGYFLTGDVAQSSEDGRSWRHLDRVSDVVLTSSGPVYSTLMEEIVHGVVDAQDCAVVGLQDTSGRTLPVIFVALRYSGTWSAEQIRAAVARTIDQMGDPNTAAPAAVVLTSLCQIPRGVTGKVLKRTLREEHRDLLKKRRPTTSAEATDVAFA